MFIALVEDFTEHLVHAVCQIVECNGTYVWVLHVITAIRAFLPPLYSLKSMHLVHYLHSAPDYPTPTLLSLLQHHTCFEHLLPL